MHSTLHPSVAWRKRKPSVALSIESRDDFLMSSVASSKSDDNSNNSHKRHEKDILDLHGWLLKWTNYIKGYQKRWFVLTDGTLSYYRRPEYGYALLHQQFLNAQKVELLGSDKRNLANVDGKWARDRVASRWCKQPSNKKDETSHMLRPTVTPRSAQQDREQK
uniref:PH domain-containing protein n=1 Tax=Romanomermis culicivorax TaxID=13658 RepID=A0A915IK19_ROMCU